MENKYLRRVKKLLPKFYTYFKHDNILVVSEDKAVLPFAYLIADEVGHPGCLLLSLAVDYAHSERAVELALHANTVRPIALSEQFFISQTGNTLVGKDAYKHFELEMDLPLHEIEPSSKTQH